MRREDQPRLLCHRRHAAQPGDAAGQADIGLQDVEAALLDQVTELVELAVHLAACDAHVDHLAQRPHALAVAAMQRLLHPVDGETFQLTRDGERILQRPGLLDVVAHAPALIAVDHQFELCADALAHGFERLDVVAPVAAMEAELQAAKAASEIGFGRLRHPAGVSERRRGRVGRDPVGAPAEQPPDGLAGDLSAEVPEREVERPAAAVVELDVVEHTEMPFDDAGVAADEEMLVPVKTGHRVARADPLRPSSVFTRVMVMSNFRAAGNPSSAGTADRAAGGDG